MNVNVFQGPYLTDVISQPDALGWLCDDLEEAKLPRSILQDIVAGRFRRVVLTGMGSSLHALYPTVRRCNGLGPSFHRLETAELLLGFDACFSQDTLLIAVSQSGESAEIVQLLNRADEFGHVIGVTNDPQSTLARRAGTTIHLRAGSESSVSCKTYICTLAAMHWLSSQFVGLSGMQAIDEIRSARQAVSEYLSGWQSHVEQWLPLIDQVQSVFVTGRGDSLATAWTAGLILKEATRQHAEGMSSAAFRHGPMEMAGESVLVVIIEGEGDEAVLNRRLAEDIQRGGGKSVLVRATSTPPTAFDIPLVSTKVKPIVEIMPIKMLSLAIAARDGIEAGRFERASKITVIA